MSRIQLSPYYPIARADYSAALILDSNGFYNQSARLCQQVVEKFIKSYFDTCLTLKDKSVLDIHSTIKLYESFCIIANVPNIYNYNLLCRKLVKYYHNTNYPGVNYLEIDKTESHSTLVEVMEFMDYYEGILS